MGNTYFQWGKYAKMMTIDVIDIVLGQFSVKHPTKIIGCCNFGHSMFGKIDFTLLDPSRHEIVGKRQDTACHVRSVESLGYLCRPTS